MKKIKRLFDYTTLLLRYEFLKRENKDILIKLDKYQLENQALRQCSIGSDARETKFRRVYRNKLNDYEDLMSMYNKVVKEKETLEKKVKKLEKEIKDGKSRNIQQSKGSARES